MARFLDADLMAECIRDEEAQRRGEIDAFEEMSRNLARAAVQYRREVARGEPEGIMPARFSGFAQIAFALADQRETKEA